MKKDLDKINKELLKEDSEIEKVMEENGLTLEYAVNKLKELMECDTKDISLRATIKALELFSKKEKKKVEIDNLNLYYLKKMKEEKDE